MRPLFAFLAAVLILATCATTSAQTGGCPCSAPSVVYSEWTPAAPPGEVMEFMALAPLPALPHPFALHAFVQIGGPAPAVYGLMSAEAAVETDGPVAYMPFARWTSDPGITPGVEVRAMFVISSL